MVINDYHIAWIHMRQCFSMNAFMCLLDTFPNLGVFKHFMPLVKLIPCLFKGWECMGAF